MRLYKAADRGVLYTKIYTYDQRRNKLREKYSVKRGVKAPEAYKHAVYNINQKIKHWRKMIDVIDKNNIRIMAIGNALVYHLGVNVKGSLLNTHPRWKEARNIFYKYCLENNISATLVAEYVGASRGDVVARQRLKFTKSFATNPKNKESYNRFCNYIKELLDSIEVKNEKF